MTEALKSIKRELGGSDSGPPPQDVLLESLQRFARTAKAATFTELKYVCYGTTVPVGRERLRVIDQPPLFDALLAQVSEREVQPKQFRRCYQGLLTGYFGYEREPESVEVADKHWVRLRGFLSDRLDPCVSASATRGILPDWLRTLADHRNLLTPDPCTRYSAALYRDDMSELRAVCAGLGIPGNSWVWQDALIAYVRLVCKDTDSGFLKRLPTLLDLVNGRSEVKLPPTLATDATARTVVRYSACENKPEHPDLRDTCVQWIGNPWLKRTAWDATVNHEPARLMVNSWLKQRLIRDFFELLAADGSADLRRLNYWLKWEPQISDMWFVLGSEAQANRAPEFVELRKRMAGRDRNLVDSNRQNNAFVMRIGPLLVIEFGVTGNACYAFAASDFRTSLNKKVLRLAELKQTAHATRLSHMTYWESRFDYELRKLLQSVPQSKGELSATIAAPVRQQPYASDFSVLPTTIVTDVQEKPSAVTASPETMGELGHGLIRRQGLLTSPSARSNPSRARLTNIELAQLERLFHKHNIEVEDNRPKGGALWVLLPDRSSKPGVASVLDLYRFRYTEGKGFWLKEED